ncbi:MAG: glycerophosphodiester phosphodiesterase [Sphingomonadales bacterium]
MLKFLPIFLFMFIMQTSTAQQTKIIAHRGAWKEFKLPENSIASLEKAIELKCDGAEFDVRRTLDGVLVVNHDPVYFGDTIQTNTYAYLNRNKLSNGESLPTLEQYFLKGTRDKHKTLLICEIKAAIKNKEQDYLATIETLELAKKLKIEKRIVFISFSKDILTWIKEQQSKATVLYLESDLSIDDVVQNKFDGINLHYTSFKNNSQLSESAKKAGLKIGSWTVNELSDLAILQQQGVEWITTNQPMQFQKQLKELKQ